MSVEAVKDFFREHAPDIEVIEHEESTATVAQAAAVLQVQAGQIAKTLALGYGDQLALFVMAGNARLDNPKFKAAFGAKPKMLTPEQTLAITGHAIGGVCPFGLPQAVQVYCDISLQAYASIYPAAGSSNSAVQLSPMRLAELVDGTWVDIGKL